MSGERKDLEPLAIFLVSKGTKGDRLLFKYPHDAARKEGGGSLVGGRRLSRSISNSRRLNPYALRTEATTLVSVPQSSLVVDGRLVAPSDALLSYLFTVKSELCGRRFELQVRDVKFLGFPLRAPKPSESGESHRRGSRERSEEAEGSPANDDEDEVGLLVYAVMVAVRATAPPGVQSLYQELCKRLGLALRHEEARCGYLSDAARPLIAALDEASAKGEPAPYAAFAANHPLPRLLKQVFRDVAERGFTSVHFNAWVEVSFAIPHKLYSRLQLPYATDAEAHLDRLSFRPYHALLLLEDAADVLGSLPLDSSPALVRLLSNLSPMKSLEATAADVDLPLSQVSLLARHLLNWGKATLIYPVCESNLYALSPELNLASNRLAEAFSDRFPHASFPSLLAEFSPQSTVGEFLSAFAGSASSNQERLPLLVWLLQRQILVQLHTFLYLCPPVTMVRSAGKAGPSREASSEDEGLSCESGEWRSETGMVVAGLRAQGVSEEILSEVARCLASAPPSASLLEDAQLLLRLAPYLDGRRHVEEMMYSENLHRAEVMRCLDRFSTVVVSHLRPDSALRNPFAATAPNQSL